MGQQCGGHGAVGVHLGGGLRASTAHDAGGEHAGQRPIGEHLDEALRFDSPAERVDLGPNHGLDNRPQRDRPVDGKV